MRTGTDTNIATPLYLWQLRTAMCPRVLRVAGRRRSSCCAGDLYKVRKHEDSSAPHIQIRQTCRSVVSHLTEAAAAEGARRTSCHPRPCAPTFSRLQLSLSLCVFCKANSSPHAYERCNLQPHFVLQRPCCFDQLECCTAKSQLSRSKQRQRCKLS